MQRILYFLCISIILTSCAQNNLDGYLVSGKLDKAKNNELVQIVRTEGRSTVVLDSTRITNSTFEFKGKIDNPDMYFIVIEGIPGGLPFILENEKIDLTIYTDSIYASVIDGGKENKLLSDHQDYAKNLRTKTSEIEEAFRLAYQNQDSVKMASLRTNFENLMKEDLANDVQFVSTNTNAVLAGVILENATMNNKMEFAQIEDLYNSLDDNIKNARAGKAVSKYLNENRNTAIGSIAPNFTAPSPEGEAITLNDIKGKVTIIDFWAAWCGPCRRENPNVVEVYKKYHDKGLEIIGVSLDGTPQQKDAKQAWLDAIEQDNLTWHQVSNLKYFNDPIAREYNINAIPATFIIDEDGKIIAKNLRGPALEQKISELLD